jgi:molybdate transport system substrate-binding protein
MKALILDALLLLALGTACARPARGSQGDVNLTVFAAASLTEAFTEIGKEFETANPGSKVTINFAGSQQLAQQLSQGAPADIYASADSQQMENVITAGRVEAGTDQIFINNQLAIVLPGDNPGNVHALKDLSRPGLHIILADAAVPVGRYSQEMLDRASKLNGFGAQFQESVLENVVSYEENVRAVLTKIILGEADAGIVYLSDYFGAREEEISMINIPGTVNVSASYYIALLSDSSNKEQGAAFIRLVLSPTGQEILERYGFSREGDHE